MGNSSRRESRKIERAELQRQALELRKAGANYEQIANQLHLANKSVAWKLVKAGIKAIVEEPAQDVLKLELDRLDVMLLGCWSKAKAGEEKAVDRVLRIMERRASYLGLDSPKAIHFDVSKLSDDALRSIVSGAAAEAPGGSGGGTQAPSGPGGEDGRLREPEPDGSGPVG